MCSLELRSWSLLLNPNTSYFFLCTLLFRLEKVTLKKVVDYSGPHKSIAFFILKATWHKGLKLGKYYSIKNLKEVVEYILPLNMTNS
jgi:hypothetical protein